MHILIIDDDPAVQELLSTYLTQLGYSVDTTGNALAGLTLAQKSPSPDLILLDGSLPEIDGMTLLDRISSEIPHIPIAVVSGQPAAEKAGIAFSKGAIEYIQKPFNFSRLDALLERFK